MLADEPTAHLDYIQVDGVLRLLRELAAPGRVVIVATHDERLLPLADHVVELTPRAAGEAVEPRTVELAPGEMLFEQGDQGDIVYIAGEHDLEPTRDRRAVDGGELLHRCGVHRRRWPARGHGHPICTGNPRLIGRSLEACSNA